MSINAFMEMYLIIRNRKKSIENKFYIGLIFLNRFLYMKIKGPTFSRTGKGHLLGHITLLHT